MRVKNNKNKRSIIQHFEKINKTRKEDFQDVFLEIFNQNATIHVSRPFDTYHTHDFKNSFLETLITSFPDIEIQPYIIMEGKNHEDFCVCIAGNFIGTFEKEWINIKPSNQATYIRFHAAFSMSNGQIDNAWFLLDILDVIRQTGIELFPTKGVQRIVSAPFTEDGIIDYPVNPEESLKSYNLTNNMLNGLLDYDGKTMDSMQQEKYWDVPKMMWYGPGGIGTTRGLKGFQKNHQIPFLKAFPDRDLVKEVTDADFINIAEGNYTCHLGYPAMSGKHQGDGWLGIKATNKHFTMRIMDFWRREGNLLRENWVMIDMIDVLEQFDINVFELLKEKQG